MSKFNEIMEVLWGIALILLAIQYFPLIGLLATIAIVLAGVKIDTLPLDRRINA